MYKLSEELKNVIVAVINQAIHKNYSNAEVNGLLQEIQKLEKIEEKKQDDGTPTPS